MPIVYPWKFIVIALVINSSFLYFCVRLIRSRRFFREDIPLIRPRTDSRTTWILLLIIVIGLLLRLWKLGQDNFETQEISYLFPIEKEFYSLFNASLAGVINVILHPANLLFSHAPASSLMFYFLSFIKQSVFSDELIFRLPSLFFGVATIWVIFLLVKDIFGRKTALVASLLFSLSPFHLYYSRSIEPYSALCFFTVTSYHLFILIFFKNRHDLTPMYLVVLILAYFFHYLSVLIIGSHFLILLLCLLFREWNSYRNYFFLLSPLVFFDGLDVLCAFLLLAFLYRFRKRCFSPMEKNLLFYLALTSIFMYIIILSFPYVAFSYYKGFPLVCAKSSYLVFPFNLSNIHKAIDFLSVLFGIFPGRIIQTGIIIFMLIYFLIIIKRKEFYSFIILVVGMTVPLFATLYGYLDFYAYAKGFYGGGYRWNILILPFTYITVSYGINLLFPWRKSIKKQDF